MAGKRPLFVIASPVLHPGRGNLVYRDRFTRVTVRDDMQQVPPGILHSAFYIQNYIEKRIIGEIKKMAREKEAVFRLRRRKFARILLFPGNSGPLP